MDQEAISIVGAGAGGAKQPEEPMAADQTMRTASKSDTMPHDVVERPRRCSSQRERHDGLGRASEGTRGHDIH